MWKAKNNSTRARHGADINARLRERRASDPEYRAKQNARALAYFRANPETRAKYSADNFQKTRIELPWLSLWYGAKNRAKKKGLTFELTQDWCAARWTGLCELSGLAFRIGLRGNGPHAFSPSIDKIDPKEGYVPDNCRFILQALNAAKATGTDEDLLFIMKALLANTNK